MNKYRIAFRGKIILEHLYVVDRFGSRELNDRIRAIIK